MEITPTASELKNGYLEEGHLAGALTALRTDGYVVLNKVVDCEHLDVLTERMTADLEQILIGPKVPHNFVWGNVQQDPPPQAPYVFGDIVANPWVGQISRALLGERVFCNGCSGNTNLPGSGLQPVHVDNGHLWPGQPQAHPMAMLVVNVPLAAVDESRGSIELWPGSHLDTSKVLGESIAVDPQRVEARRQGAPPLRCNSQKGSILLRDMRLWHRGTPNVSEEPRFMLAMVHNCRWLRRRSPGRFVRGCEAAFAGSLVEYNIEFIEGPVDYLYHNKPYDYDGPN